MTSLAGKEDLESGLGSDPSVLYEVGAFLNLSPEQRLEQCDVRGPGTAPVADEAPATAASTQGFPLGA